MVYTFLYSCIVERLWVTLDFYSADDDYSGHLGNNTRSGRTYHDPYSLCNVGSMYV